MAINNWKAVDPFGGAVWAQCDPETGNCGNAPANMIHPLWSSDTVFCLSGTSDLWQLVLYLALLFWVVVTTVNVLQTFQWRGLQGFAISEVVKAIARQIALLLLACGSFALLLAVHQLLYLLVNGLVGNLYSWRVDSLWLVKLRPLILQSQSMANNLDPNSGAGSGLFGGNQPDGTGPFGLTWAQIFGGLGSLEDLLMAAILPVRFVVLFVAVIAAPLAILSYSLGLTRQLFSIWLKFWLEVEGLALGSALVLAAYQYIRGPLNSLMPIEQGYVLLGLTGLVCGANLYFLWRIIGQFLTNIATFYQAEYQRERQQAGIIAQVIVGIGGLVATVLTDGAALPFVLGAEGLLNAGLNQGAIPGGPVPGAGVGQSLIGAGNAYVSNQRAQASLANQQANLEINQQRLQLAQAQAAQRQSQRQLPAASGQSGGTGTPGLTLGAASGTPPGVLPGGQMPTLPIGTGRTPGAQGQLPAPGALALGNPAPGTLPTGIQRGPAPLLATASATGAGAAGAPLLRTGSAGPSLPATGAGVLRGPQPAIDLAHQRIVPGPLPPLGTDLATPGTAPRAANLQVNATAGRGNGLMPGPLPPIADAAGTNQRLRSADLGLGAGTTQRPGVLPGTAPTISSTERSAGAESASALRMGTSPHGATFELRAPMTSASGPGNAVIPGPRPTISPDGRDFLVGPAPAVEQGTPLWTAARDGGPALVVRDASGTAQPLHISSLEMPDADPRRGLAFSPPPAEPFLQVTRDAQIPHAILRDAETILGLGRLRLADYPQVAQHLAELREARTTGEYTAVVGAIQQQMAIILRYQNGPDRGSGVVRHLLHYIRQLQQQPPEED